MFKVNNKDTKTTLAIGHWRRSGIFIVNFEHISHLALAFLERMLTNLDKGFFDSYEILNHK